jgi:hypothetical protein
MNLKHFPSEDLNAWTLVAWTLVAWTLVASATGAGPDSQSAAWAANAEAGRALQGHADNEDNETSK